MDSWRRWPRPVSRAERSDKLGPAESAQHVSRSKPSGADNAPKKPDSKRAGEQKTNEREEVHPEHVRAARCEDTDQARADQPADYDQRDDEAVEGDVDLVHELVQALVHEPDFDLAVTDLLEEVVHLVRQRSRDPRQLGRLFLRP